MAFDDPEAIRELFSTFGTVSVRRMFGGHGVFADGIMFALESGGELYLKADDLTIPKLSAENSEPLVYKAKGREIALSSAPDETPLTVDVPVTPPEPAPAVVFSAPVADEVDVEPRVIVRVQFSRDMDARSFKDQIRVSYVAKDAADLPSLDDAAFDRLLKDQCMTGYLPTAVSAGGWSWTSSPDG